MRSEEHHPLNRMLLAVEVTTQSKVKLSSVFKPCDSYTFSYGEFQYSWKQFFKIFAAFWIYVVTWYLVSYKECMPNLCASKTILNMWPSFLFAALIKPSDSKESRARKASLNTIGYSSAVRKLKEIKAGIRLKDIKAGIWRQACLLFHTVLPPNKELIHSQRNTSGTMKNFC